MAGSEGCGQEQSEMEKLRQGPVLHLGVKGLNDDDDDDVWRDGFDMRIARAGCWVVLHLKKSSRMKQSCPI